MALVDFHHYKGDRLSPAERVERAVVELLLSSDLTDGDRESSKVWELKHSSGCCQIARILAYKRGLNVEISEVAALLHDIYVIVEGKYANHAALGAPIAERLLDDIGGFSSNEVATISRAIAQHSQKDVHTDDPYVELVKDVDVFDCSLYRGSEDYYLIHKPRDVVVEYAKRAQRVRDELGLDHGDTFRK